MNPEITYLSVPDVVHVKATGKLNFEVGKGLVKDILKVAEEHECKKVICDYCDMKLTATPFDLYNNPYHFNQWGVPHDFRIAIVYSENERDYKFWETLARNRGYIARVFNDKDGAILWLTET